MNYLVDGSFASPDWEQTFRAQVDALSAGGRKPFLFFYLVNGPSQRRWTRTFLHGFGADISPREYRERIQSDEDFREGFRKLVASLVPALAYAASRGAEISIFPAGLEDNLDAAAFTASTELVLSTIPASLAIRIGRNPHRLGDSPGRAKIPGGFFIELHSFDLAPLLFDGVVTNDGDNCQIEDLTPASGRIPYDELLRTLESARRNNNAFLLWDASRQGLPDGGRTARYPAADERVYAIPDSAESAAIVRTLRAGLE